MTEYVALVQSETEEPASKVIVNEYYGRQFDWGKLVLETVSKK
jgi:hypothetical protein